MTDKGPRTAEGAALLDQFPFTATRQTCCPYPHGGDSGPDIEPRHTRTTETERRPDAILAIEDAAFAQGIAAARAAVEGLPRIIDGKVVNESDVLVRGKVLAALDSTDRP